MLGERSQMQKVIYLMIPFVSNVQNREIIHRDRKQMRGYQMLSERGNAD